jgi:hypothetical protein
MDSKTTRNPKPKFKVGELVKVNNGVSNRGVVRSVCRRPDKGYDALVEVSGEPLFKKAIFWIPESELAEAG